MRSLRWFLAIALAGLAAPWPSAASAAGEGFVRFDGRDLKFEQRAGGEARLFVRSGSTWRVHRGRTLAAILRDQPSLAAHPEAARLRTRVSPRGPSRFVARRVVPSPRPLVTRSVARRTVEDRDLPYQAPPDRRDPRLREFAERVDVVRVREPAPTLQDPGVIQTFGFDAFSRRLAGMDPNLTAIRPDTANLLDLRYSSEAVSAPR
jgi:hypothetical protein